MLLGLQDWQYYNIIRALRSFTNWSSLRRGTDWWHLQEPEGDVALAINKRVDLGRNVILNSSFLNWSGANDIDDWTEQVVANSEITQVDSGALHGGASGTGGSVNFWNDTAGSNRPVILQPPGAIGKEFKCTVVVSAYASGTMQAKFGGTVVALPQETGTHVVTATCTASGDLGIRNANANICDFTIDSVIFEQTDIAASTEFPGAERLANPGNPYTFTADDPDGWTVVGEVGADPEVSEVGAGEGHGGTGVGYINLFSTATANRPLIRQVILPVGARTQIQVLIDTLNNGSLSVIDAGLSFDERLTTVGDHVFEVTPGSDTLSIRGILSPTVDATLKVTSVRKANPLNADNNGMAVAQTADGFLGLRYLGDGGATYLDLTSAEHNSKLDPTEFHVALWFQKDTWDTTERDILSYTVDADNWIRIVDTTTAGTLSFQFRAGGTTEEVTLATGSPTTDVPVGISVSGGIMKAWYGTGQTGSNQTVAGTFVGNFETMLAFARTTDPTFVHLGAGAHIMIADHELSTDEWANLTTRDGV